MKIRFLHCADIHLGYVQYGHKERFNDFAAAFNALIDKALGKETVRRDGRRVSFDEKFTGKVDFVILAGDLFHKRAIDALTLNQAMHALQRLQDAGVPCIAVEGNHELAYFDDTIGWMRFLALQDLLILLDAEFQDGVAQLKPWDARKRQGSYVDIKGTGGTVRIHGLRYYGASTATAINAYARALDEVDHEGVDYTIFLTHAGLEGQMEDKAGGLSYRQWTALQPHADYVALGHFHKPFAVDDWIYNPGSPESCAINEAAWKPRGYLMVEVDTDRQQGDVPKHKVFPGDNPRRAFRQYPFRVDHVQSPEDLLDRLREFLQRSAAELREKTKQGGAIEQLPPVVELYLTGALPFDRSRLDIGAIEELVRECFNPLVAIVKNLTQSAEYVFEGDANLPRAELERQVIQELLEGNKDYASRAVRLAELTVLLKQLVLAGAQTDNVLQQMEDFLQQSEVKT